MGRLRMTLQTKLVLSVLAQSPQDWFYGLQVAQAVGLASGTVYPILGRLNEAGWVESAWEEIDESTEGRRKRCYHRITAEGEKEAKALLGSRARMTLGVSERGRG